MDAKRFDALIRAIESRAPRRSALGALGGLTALLTQLHPGDIEAKKKKGKKKKKKKCKGKKKCGKTCVPKSGCCSDAECSGGQSCVGNRCACPEGFILCGNECIEDFLCCVDGDCFDIYTCEGGFCTCKADPSDVPCSEFECCDPATEVCAASDSGAECQAGGCPAGTDICNDTTSYFCGGPSGCVCTTSVEDRTVCTDFAGSCMSCTNDEQCANALDQDAICITIGGTCSCEGGETTACVAVGCPSGFGVSRAEGRSAPRRDLPRPSR